MVVARVLCPCSWGVDWNKAPSAGWTRNGFGSGAIRPQAGAGIGASQA
ncbi:hypothetical protein [Azospirillum palustre]